MSAPGSEPGTPSLALGDPASPARPISSNASSTPHLHGSTNAMPTPGSQPGTPSLAPDPSSPSHQSNPGSSHHIPNPSPQHEQQQPPLQPPHPQQQQQPPPPSQQQHMGHDHPVMQMPLHGPQQPQPPVSSQMLSSGPGPHPQGPPPPMSMRRDGSSVPLDSQYMQQQSQIFVFTTALANAAADAVSSGHFPSVIAFHCSQPGTKSFLEQHPLKITQFNRPNNTAWMNNLAHKSANKMFKPMNPAMMANMNANQFQGDPNGGPQSFPPFNKQMPPNSGFGPCNPNGPGPPPHGNWSGPDGPWQPQQFAQPGGNMGGGPRFPGGPRPPGSAMMGQYGGGPNNFNPNHPMNSNFPPNSSCITTSSLHIPTGN